MRSPIPDYLAEVLHACEGHDAGHVADYIPELAKADPDQLGIVLTTVGGAHYSAGDVDHEVSIQSVSKPFAYALALADRGFDAVLAKINVEPSGDAFNEISLDPETGRPSNPMINAGAIATHALIEGGDVDERSKRVLEHFSTLAGRELTVDEAVCDSELDAAYRNRALANLLRSRDIITGDPEEALRGYIRQCSILVTPRDLARMAATLAGGGVDPVSGSRVVDRLINRQVLSVMSTCGMYDAAGDWATEVGIPAKSGVSGVLIGSLPGQVGIATFSPNLDAHGNSTRGVEIFERLSRDMGMHMMDPPQTARSVLRSRREGTDGEVIEVEGAVQFPQAEALIRNLVQHPIRGDKVTYDLSRVFSANDVALRMLKEGERRLRADGVRVEVIDPEHIYR